MNKVQEQFNSNSSGDFTLSPGEYEGPLVVERPCVVDGRGSTLWAKKGPVLVVSAPNVTIRNLRVEVTGNPEGREAFTAIKTSDPNTKLENIEVYGNVVGSAGESESWELPSVISLGEFAADKTNTFTVSLDAPSDAKLLSKVKGLQVQPEQLIAGQNRLTLTTDGLRHNTILYGELMVQSSVSRRIYITGKALNNGVTQDKALARSKGPAVSLPVPINPSDEIIAPRAADETVPNMRRGQRISIKELGSSQLKIIFEHQSGARDMDIDSYCFLLGENGKVSRDEDLIFFGNTEAPNQSVKSVSADSNSLVLIDLNKVDSSVSKIVVSYSIYGDHAQQNFSMVTSPAIRVFCHDKEVFRFELKDLSEEKTVVAAEIYQYKGQWKMRFVGSGYRSGLKQLCEGYGVNVE